MNEIKNKSNNIFGNASKTLGIIDNIKEFRLFNPLSICSLKLIFNLEKSFICLSTLSTSIFFIALLNVPASLIIVLIAKANGKIIMIIIKTKTKAALKLFIFILLLNQLCKG